MGVMGTSIRISECLWEYFSVAPRPRQGNRGHDLRGSLKIPGMHKILTQKETEQIIS